jgi:type I restriction enzyme S subunit
MENLENLFKLAEERSNSAICYLTTGSVNQLSEAQNLDSWLSDAPETWKRGSLKRFCDITLGKMVSPNLGENDNYYPYLKASSIQPKGNLVLDEEIRMPFTTREIEKLSIKQGDVLVVEGGSIGRTAYFSDDLPGWGFQNSLNRVRVKNQGYGRYASYIIEAARISGVFDAITSVSTIAHLTAEKLEQVRIVWPPYEDQVSISEDLHHELGNLYRLQELIGELIGVTSERMKARIAAAVTGQLNTGIYVNG